MNVIGTLGEIYKSIDNQYASIELQARSRGHFRKEAAQQKIRELNDQAYFLFMFSRLEERIKTLSTDIIDNRCNNTVNYRNQRVWRMIKQRNDNQRLDLMERASLITVFNGADYQQIHRYKTQRDAIAHGRNVQITNMNIIISDMSSMYERLKHTP